MNFTWFYGIDDPLIKDAWALRRRVFVEEQAVPEEEEIDGLDNKRYHVVGFLAGSPVATARVYFLQENMLKIQRVAVDKTVRGQHVGSNLMEQIEIWAKNKNAKQLILSAQDPVIPFYESLDYYVSNPAGYLDAGIPHHDMQKDLQ